MTRLRISSIYRIVEVAERETCLGATRGTHDKPAQFYYTSNGWWITLDSGISFCVGNEKPDLSAGDYIILSLTKTSPPNEQPNLHPADPAPTGTNDSATNPRSTTPEPSHSGGERERENILARNCDPSRA